MVSAESDNKWQLLQCIKQLSCILRGGGILIDSARGYGNQKEIGLAIKNAILDGIITRDKLFLTQKLGGDELGYDNILKIFEDGCENYGTDYIDIMLIYFPLDYNPYWKRYVIDSYRALEKLYIEGKVKAIGVSNFGVSELTWLLNYAKIKPMINQIELHPYYQQRMVVNLCKQMDIKLQAWSPLMYVVDNNYLRELGVKYNKSSAQIALKWSQQKGYIPIFSSKIEKEIKQSLELSDFNLSQDEISRIDSLDGGMHSIDNQVRPTINTEQVLQELVRRIFYKAITYERTYKLFGIFPILKQRKYNWNKTKWFLFGIIPLFKCYTKDKK